MQKEILRWLVLTCFLQSEGELLISARGLAQFAELSTSNIRWFVTTGLLALVCLFRARLNRQLR